MVNYSTTVSVNLKLKLKILFAKMFISKQRTHLSATIYPNALSASRALKFESRIEARAASATYFSPTLSDATHIWRPCQPPRPALYINIYPSTGVNVACLSLYLLLICFRRSHVAHRRGGRTCQDISGSASTANADRGQNDLGFLFHCLARTRCA